MWDISNLYPSIFAYSRKVKHGFSFLHPSWTDPEGWKAKARTRLGGRLSMNSERSPLNAFLAERQETDLCVAEKVYFNSTPEIRIPAFFLKPRTYTGKLPAIIVMHEHGGAYYWGREKVYSMDHPCHALVNARHRTYGGPDLAVDLVKKGFAVFVADSFYFGERRLDIEQIDIKKISLTILI